MRIGLTIFAAALAVTPVNPPPALAQQQDQRLQAEPPRRPPLRLDVRPTGRYYRQCEDSYAVERRATGDTIVPRTRCWWAVR